MTLDCIYWLLKRTNGLLACLDSLHSSIYWFWMVACNLFPDPLSHSFAEGLNYLFECTQAWYMAPSFLTVPPSPSSWFVSSLGVGVLYDFQKSPRCQILPPRTGPMASGQLGTWGTLPFLLQPFWAWFAFVSSGGQATKYNLYNSGDSVDENCYCII